MQIETNKQMAGVKTPTNWVLKCGGYGVGAAILLFAIVGVIHHTSPAERGPRLAELINGAIYLFVLVWLGSGCRAPKVASQEKEGAPVMVKQRNVLTYLQSSDGIVYTDGRPVNEADANIEDDGESVDAYLAQAV